MLESLQRAAACAGVFMALCSPNDEGTFGNGDALYRAWSGAETSVEDFVGQAAESAGELFLGELP